MRLRNVLMIIGILFCVTLCSCSIAPQKEYTVTLQCYVNNLSETPAFSSDDITASKGSVDTYTVILQSRSVLDAVIKQSGFDYTYEELRSMIKVVNKDDSEVFEIRITAPNKADAAKIADTLATVLPEKLENILEGSNFSIVDIIY